MNRKSFIRLLAALAAWWPRAGYSHDTRCKTDRDAEGPFFKAGAPLKSILEKEGEPLVIEGRVFRGDDCRTAVANAVLDIWHCDNDGDYDMQGFRCRGLVRTDQKGYYRFTTIYPPHYGRRPRHIHFKIRAAGFDELTTQLYFQGDPNIQNDFARDAGPNRVVELTSAGEGKKGVFNIYL